MAPQTAVDITLTPHNPRSHREAGFRTPYDTHFARMHAKTKTHMKHINMVAYGKEYGDTENEENRRALHRLVVIMHYD